MPSNTVEDVEAQEKLLAEAEEKTARLRCAADLLLSVEFQGVSPADKQSLHDSMAIQAGHYVENGTIEEFRQTVCKVLKGQQTFHWSLEFPEVFQKRNGFDGIVGNPPFLGGTRISTTLGTGYLSYLQSAWGKGNRGDLCRPISSSVRVNSMLAVACLACWVQSPGIENSRGKPHLCRALAA